MPEIRVKRVYDDPAPGDGHRVLVDRLWPRGMTKADARLDEWLKDVAPSHDLRRWIHQDMTRWSEFERRYVAELVGAEAVWRPLVDRVGMVTLLVAAKDPDQNHAAVLRAFLVARCGDGRGPGAKDGLRA